MAELKATHWIVLGLVVGGVATQLSNVHDGWSEVWTPRFVAGMLMQVSSAIVALFTNKPGVRRIVRR